MPDKFSTAEAVELVRSGRHAFIEASAGSGKTTRLTDIIAEILTSGSAEIDEILCVTFTEKAASELKARIYKKLQSLVSPAAGKALARFTMNQIGTIHEFCLRQLAESPRDNLAETGGTNAKEHEIFDEAREWVFRNVWPEFDSTRLSALLNECNFGSGGKQRSFDADLRKKALFCFANPGAALWPAVIDPAAVKTGSEFKSYTLQRIIERMREITSQRNLMTFAGMITGFAAALEDAVFAQKIRSEFKFALIDEFQDTDQVQWKIFHTLFLQTGPTAPTTRLIVVGDPKQAIYKFRGADVFVYWQAKEELVSAGAMTQRLNTNFRSAPELLRAQDAIFSAGGASEIWQQLQIDYLPAAYGGLTQSTADACTGMELYHCDEYNKSNEIKFNEISAQRITEIRNLHPDWTIAIIAFRHRSLSAMAETLSRHRIPYAYYKQKPDFTSLEVEHLKILLESLTLSLADGYTLAATTIFLSGSPEPEAYYAKLYAYAEQGRILSLLQALARNSAPLHLLLGHYADAPRFHAWRVLFQILLQLCGKTIFDLASFRRVLFDLCDPDNSDDLSGDMLSGKGAVTLLTVQSAKGLDWNVVILADGAHDKRWNDFAFYHDVARQPIVPANTKEFDASTEKLMESSAESLITQLNLLYVALTRAKHKFITYVSPNYVSIPAGPASRFLQPWLLNSDMPQRFVTLIAMPDSPIVTALAEELHAEITDAVTEYVSHGDIPRRISQRTSFTALSTAEFAHAHEAAGLAVDTYQPLVIADGIATHLLTETTFADDVLPRGALTGQLMHDILENCNFSAFAHDVTGTKLKMQPDTLREVNRLFVLTPERAIEVTERILHIVGACATAALPLLGRGKTAPSLQLCQLPGDSLWREMPFWSTSSIHRVLRGDRQKDPVRRTMHGYMDLVFTADRKDYYILDYKSNSLADVEPENISEYTQKHYGLQAEIYAEALSAYLTACYPESGARVAGCYFVDLRYLRSNESTGVHFMGINGK